MEFQTPDLEFPEAALYGRLGELAKGMKMPLGLAYPALLACYSVVPNMDDVRRENQSLTLRSSPARARRQRTPPSGGRRSPCRFHGKLLEVRSGGDTQLCVALGDKPKVNEKGNRDGKKREPGSEENAPAEQRNLRNAQEIRDRRLHSRRPSV